MLLGDKSLVHRAKELPPALWTYKALGTNISSIHYGLHIRKLIQAIKSSLIPLLKPFCGGPMRVKNE